jgi:hypothetical protein
VAGWVPVPAPAGEDPRYHKASLVVGDQFVVKFAWSRPAALRLGREIGILTTLAAEPADHRTPPDWIDDLAARFRALGMGRFD